LARAEIQLLPCRLSGAVGAGDPISVGVTRRVVARLTGKMQAKEAGGKSAGEGQNQARRQFGMGERQRGRWSGCNSGP